MKKTTSGFTIVELLIVIVVIAILAAISIVVYNGIQDRARTTALQSDLANAKKKLMVYQINNDSYPTNSSELANAGIQASKSVYDTTNNNYFYCYNTVNKEFAIGARTAGSMTSYIYNSSGGGQVGGAIYGGQVCQSIGLTGYSDVNGYATGGYSSTTGWASWVN